MIRSKGRLCGKVAVLLSNYLEIEFHRERYSYRYECFIISSRFVLIVFFSETITFFDWIIVSIYFQRLKIFHYYKSNSKIAILMDLLHLIKTEKPSIFRSTRDYKSEIRIKNLTTPTKKYDRCLFEHKKITAPKKKIHLFLTSPNYTHPFSRTYTKILHIRKVEDPRNLFKLIRNKLICRDTHSGIEPMINRRS